MLRFVNFDIVFQEVPGEVTMAINISNCPNRCKGCHSPYLMKNIGEPLTPDNLSFLIEKYGSGITCVCFMGGDSDPFEVERLADFIKDKYPGKLKVVWYSGKDCLPEHFPVKNFDFIKIGSYKEERGGLSSPDTNQRFYQVFDEKLIDKTNLFLKKPLK